MRRKLDWIEILNEQTRWHSRACLVEWFTERIGRSATVLDGTVEGLEELLRYMRQELFNLHFGEPPDLLWMDRQLKTVTFGLLHHQGAQEGSDSQLPHFRACVKGMHDTDLLRAVKDTLLVQFAEFMGGCLDCNQCAVMRCEGVYRESANHGHSMVVSARYASELEERWRQEIPLLASGHEGTAGMHRCANLFIGTAKTRFCTDTCRFATFQLAKQIEHPGYLAEKQRRYRRRQERQVQAAQAQAAPTPVSAN